MDFSDTQDIGYMYNIFQAKLLKTQISMLHLKFYYRKKKTEKKAMDNKSKY